MKRLLLYALVFWPVISSAAEPTAAMVKPLESYSLADRLWLGSFGGDVAVNPSMDVPATRSGEIKWEVEEGSTVKEGGLVARLHPEADRRRSRDEAQGRRVAALGKIGWIGTSGGRVGIKNF